MKKVHDIAKKRRQYVARIWFYKAFIALILADLVFLCGPVLADLAQRRASESLLSNVEMLGFMSVCSLFCAWLLRTEARADPYVPPVREQIAQAPPEETLLRGSDIPAAPEELLRPVLPISDTEVNALAENLLRPSQES